MIHASTEYEEKVLLNRQFLTDITITFPNGNIIKDIDNDLLMSGGLQFDDAVSANGRFEVGTVIAKQCTILLNNSDERFSEYDFRGAAIRVKIGLQLEKAIEWLNKGEYYVETARTTGVAISIVAVDAMLKFDRAYKESKLVYPASLLEIYRDVCQVCGIARGTERFTNDNYVVKTRPNDEALTFREVLACVAQIACCFARINVSGALELKWYDLKYLERESSLWGGNYTDYSTGDDAWGGNFTDYNSGDDYYGGDFTSFYSFHHFYNLLSQSIETDDIVITGVKVSETQGEGMLEQTIYSKGEEGYIVGFDKNVLIQSGEGEVVVDLIAKELIGLRFRPLSVSIQFDPCIEAGDCAVISDKHGNTYRTIISSTKSGLGMTQTIRADAETPTENTSDRYSEAAKSYVLMRQTAKQEVQNYDVNVKKLDELLSNGLGFYTTYEKVENGGEIKYMHDKPLLTDSQTVYRQTLDAYAVSTDGGKTWNYGHTKDGNIIAKTLSVIGINADWLTVGGYNDADGVIVVKDGSGTQFIRIGKDGITMSNGARLVGGNGVLSHIQVDSVDDRGAGSFRFCGYYQSPIEEFTVKQNSYLWVNVPDDFTITEASITLYHAPLAYSRNYPERLEGIGYARNLKLYKTNDLENYKWWAAQGLDYGMSDNTGYVEIKNAFGANGFTGNAQKMVMIKSTDIAAVLETGLNLLKIETDAKQPTTRKETSDSAGVVKAVINITGYMS